MAKTIVEQITIILVDHHDKLWKRISERFDKIEKHLDFNQGELKKMATSAELEQAVQDVISTVTQGYASIDSAVQSAADRVIASLQSGADPAAQVAELQAFKDSIGTQVQAEVDKVNAIDPTAEPTA